MIFRKEKKKKELKMWHLLVVLFFIIAALVFRVFNRILPQATVSINSQNFVMQVADNSLRRQKGLSGKKDLGKYDGMIFLFEKPIVSTMVMRNMEFALDFIWVNGETVVDIAPNVPTEPDVAENELKHYFPRTQANIVIEVPAGFSSNNNLKIGDKITWQRK
jgi:uncharacterized membrane protein (UPF0127 family)